LKAVQVGTLPPIIVSMLPLPRGRFWKATVSYAADSLSSLAYPTGKLSI
jgi:hypothetical protein